jgi:vacuolar-type H+-ATPase subunit I/STV1
LTVEALLETRLLHPWIGWIPRDQRDRLALPRLQTPLVIVHAMERDDQVLVFAASDAEHGFVLERIMRSVFGRRLSLLDHLGEEAEALQRGHEELAQLARRRDELARKRRQLAEQWRDSLEALLATVRRDLSAARIAAGLRRRGAAWFLAGDIPEDGFERLVTAVQGAADGPHAIFAAGDR